MSGGFYLVENPKAGTKNACNSSCAFSGGLKSGEISESLCPDK
jgi:hypothetical protein